MEAVHEKTKTIIRPILPSEVSAFIPSVAAGYVREFGHSYWNSDFAIKSWEGFLLSPKYTMFGAFEGETFLGLICGRVSVDIYSGQIEGSEMGWYVFPEYRKNNIGVKLLLEFEQWCKSRGAKRITMVYMDGPCKEEMLSLYQRMGFSPMQYSVVKEI